MAVTKVAIKKQLWSSSLTTGNFSLLNGQPLFFLAEALINQEMNCFAQIIYP